MALTIEQIRSNMELDWRIKEAEIEHKKYVNDLAVQKMKFELDNPDFPKDRLDLMFISVCAPRQIIGIRYVDGDLD